MDTKSKNLKKITLSVVSAGPQIEVSLLSTRVVTVTKPQSGRNNRNSQWKDGDCPSGILIKRSFKVQWSPFFIPFQNDDNKTILKNLEQQLMSPMYHILNFAKILEGEIERLTKMVASIEH